MSEVTLTVQGNDVVLPWAELTAATTMAIIGADGTATFQVACKNVSASRKAGRVPRAYPAEGPHAGKVQVSVGPVLFINPDETKDLTVIVEQLETIPAGEAVDIIVEVD